MKGLTARWRWSPAAHRASARPIAYRFADEGVHVAVGGRDAARTAAVAEAAAARARAAGHDVVVIAGLWATSRVVGDCERLVAETVERHGRLDILVNSAGVWLEKPILETNEADWDWCVDIGLKGTYFMCRAALRHMLPRRSGVIVNIASDSGIHGEPGAAVYSAAKAGVVMLTRALAIDHGPDGIRVTSVSPATFETPMVARTTPRPPTRRRMPTGWPRGPRLPAAPLRTA